MKMNKKINILYLIATLGLLSSCEDDTNTVYTVDDAYNTILLRARMNEGVNGVVTRAVDGNHAKHVLFTEGNKLSLQINGSWTGHDPATITQTTTATVGAESASGSKHNALEMDPNRFWNDYGVADPDNADGRSEGLTIYGAAVNDKEAAAPNVTVWENLSWSLLADQTNGWLSKDLLTSNNITSSADGTYKFDDFMENKTGTSNILEFTHAMSKMTVVLTAGAGFIGGKFVNNPTVTLKQFKYTGSVNIKTKTTTPSETKSDIKMHLAEGGAGNTSATLDALVYPGNSFAKVDDILELTADGNTFVVTAAKLNAAIQKAIDDKSSTGYPGENLNLQQGWNYKLLITVNKTNIVVVATIVDWNDVTAEPEAPEIRIAHSYGHVPGTDFGKGFTLYRSTLITGTYLGDGDKADVSFASSKYSMTPQLYWPTHSTHYFFRGVWPVVDSKDGSEAQLGPTSGQVQANTIDVENVAYKQGYYPSDLMIGRPLNTEETATDEQCKVDAHKDGSGNSPAGICATTGEIRMNFRYMMSQVKVELTSSNPEDKDYIAFDADTKVEIIGGYKDGAIRLSDCTSDFTGKSVAPYQLNNKANDDYDSYHDAIIPQNLTETLNFRITVKNSDGSTDTYETVIKNIKVKEGDADPALISAWASGKAYTYNLKITKTAIKVTATLTDWVPVEASENVWF